MVEQQEPGLYHNPYKFNVKELDQETGLYYYGARYYNPRLSIWYGVDPLAEKMPSWSPYVYTFDNPVKFVDPDGREPLDWIRQVVNGKSTWTYDASIKTTSQATAAGYSNVEGVYSSATISRGSTLGFGGYQYELRSTGWVEEVSSGSYISMENDFVTGGGTAINGVQHRPTFADKMGFSDGPIQYIGGPGDPLGIFEAGGMALSSGDNSGGNYILAAFLITRGDADDALKLLGAEKGSLSGTKGALTEAKSKIGLGATETLPKSGTGKFGSPQRGNGLKGYRLDPAHPNAKPGSGEEYPHVNYWDYSAGKRGKGGISGAIPIKE